MFIVKDRSGMGLPDRECHSFTEVAAEIGCSESALRLRLLDPTPVPAVHRFLAINLDDYARLVREHGLAGKVTPPDGFPGVVRYDEVARESGLSSAHFIHLLRDAHVHEPRVECLTAEGRAWAVANLGHLILESVPPEIRGPEVTEYRNLCRNELLSAESAADRGLTEKDKARIVGKVRAFFASRKKAAA
jgi:hypothetical protein